VLFYLGNGDTLVSLSQPPYNFDLFSETLMFPAEDTNHGQRFAEKSAEATLGYAHAGYYAGIFAAAAIAEAWTDACAEASKAPAPGSKSWFRDPTKCDVFDPLSFFSQSTLGQPTPGMSNPWSGQNWFAQPWFSTCWLSPSTPTSKAWAAFMPTAFTETDLSFTRSPFWNTQAAALPMTWSLMSFGLPHAVAKPTAEANTAALEAFDSARQVANDHLAAYQGPNEPTSEKTMSENEFDPFDAYTQLFWLWLGEASSTEVPEAA